jgi:hypothetical protein
MFFHSFIGGTMNAFPRMLAAIAAAAIVSTVGAWAQVGTSGAEKGKPDPRIKAALDEAEVKYSIDKDGDYRVINRIDSNRTQLAWVVSRTSSFGKIEVRDVLSIAYKTSGELPPRLMQRLLEANNRTKIGAWAVQREGDQTIVLFRTQVSADAGALPLLHAILAVTITADALENELLGSDDY